MGNRADTSSLVSFERGKTSKRSIPQVGHEISESATVAGHVGLEFTDVGEGWTRGELSVDDELTNPYGTLHGGVPDAMADTTMGAALQSELEAGEQCATIERRFGGDCRSQAKTLEQV